MRILMHGMNYAPELIGIGRYTGELGAWLASRGHAVTVLTAPPYYPQWRVEAAYRRRGPFREWLDGVEVLRAPLYVPARVTGRGRVWQELSFGASGLFWWLSYVLRQRWDAVVAICPPLSSGVISAWLARRQGIPFIFHLQDLQLDAARELGLLRQPVLLSGLSRLERLLLARAQAVTTISRSMAEGLRDKGVAPARLHLLPNWADLDNIVPGRRQNELRRELGIGSEVIVLYAGNLGEKQGLEMVLEAAALTRKEPAIRYILAGEGAAGERLRFRSERLGLDNLIFLPIQSPGRFAQLLAAGDVHLVVQKQQASDLVMPSKLANIMAAGRPFVATARPETELGAVTLSSQAGILVPPEDGEALAGAILKLAKDQKARKRLGLKARRYAETWLDRETILGQWEELLDGLARGRGH